MWRALAIRDEWFTELETTEAKDVVEQTTGKMIVELSEGIVLDNKSKNQVKSMLSRQSPTVRMAYGHNAQEFPIQFCFAGCHNQHEFARDDDGSGLRRFWTIPIHRKANNPYDWASFIADVPQIWAEVKTWYDHGELLEIPEEHMQALNEQRNLSIIQDEWEQDVINFLDAYLSSKLDGKSKVKNRVCIKQIAIEALGLDYSKISRYDSHRIKDIMNKQTNWKYNGRKNMDMKTYGPQKGWSRIDTDNEKGE
jgi:predicted P-loop ATPase